MKLRLAMAVTVGAGLVPLLSGVSQGAYIYHVSTGSYWAQSTATSSNASLRYQQLIYDPLVMGTDPSNINLPTSYVVGFTVDVSWVGAVVPDPSLNPPVTPLNGFTITNYVAGPNASLGLSANEVQVSGDFAPFSTDPSQHPSTPVFQDQNFFTLDFASSDPNATAVPIVHYTANAIHLSIVDEFDPNNPVLYQFDSSNTTFLPGTATTTVPEPASIGAVMLGALAVMAIRRSRRMP